MKQPATSSGSIAVTTGASVVPSGPTGSQVTSGYVTSLIVTGGSSAGTASLYDGTDTSGVLLATLAGVPAGTTQQLHDLDVVFNKGLFIVVSGTGSTAIVHSVLGD